MTPERLNEVKKQVQTILDHHLPEEKRFSVEDFDEATLLLLTQFLLAKDKSERDKIRVKIQKTVKKKKMELDLISNDMLESVDSIKSLSNTKKEISSLEGIILQDNDLDEQLNFL
jgi:hypothetical protein